MYIGFAVTEVGCCRVAVWGLMLKRSPSSRGEVWFILPGKASARGWATSEHIPGRTPGRGGRGPYLSMLITHRVMIEAVQHMTSMAMKTLQKKWPKIHLPPMRSVTLTKGMTATATERSASARDTIR